MKKFFNVLQEMENTKLKRPTISEITDTNEVKMDLLTMNLFFNQICKISELNDLINKYGSGIVISTMPICKYNGQTFIMKYEFSKEAIISLIENGEKVIIYNEIDGTESNKLPYKYLCAIITSDGNVNDPYPIKALAEEDKIITPFIYHKPVPITEFKPTSPMINPITYELINPESWEDGLHLQPNLMDENLEINMVFEVKDKKVIRVYKQK
jgi:hypothetical protein